MTTAQKLLNDCNGFVKGLAYTALLKQALKLADYDDEPDPETLITYFKDGSRLVFMSGEIIKVGE